MSILEKFRVYRQAEIDIHQYFGFQELWRVYALEDLSGVYWRLDGDNIIWHNYKKSAFDKSEEYENDTYEAEIINNHVYEKEDFTLILNDHHADGNIFLSVFDNSKRVIK
jgi:hypothetical protein